MQLTEGKKKLIEAWGTLGSSWGINRAMAQIHALLMVAPQPLSTDDIMEQLNISRGNANMNVRSLMEWGIVKKELKAGERKEFFYTDKDIWALARQVARERQRRELVPIIDVLSEVQNVEGGDKVEVEEFNNVVKDLKGFTENLNGIFDKFGKSDQHWFYKTLLNTMK
ncbi:MAG: transcriptional regulator [Flavobacteriales bacterium]|nr:transcriptional regulator [Flavobacteriales bacterium]